MSLPCHFAALALALSVSAAHAQPTLTLEPSAVVVDGATPGAQVAWLSVSRRPMETHQQVEILRDLTEADSAGQATLPLADPITLKSLWAAVDLETGEFALAVPAEMVLQERALLPNAFAVDTTGEPALLRHDRRQVDALVVRPGSTGTPGAAWAGRVEDGGALDAGPAWDGAIELRLADLPPLAEGGEPATSFAAGDVVVLIDPERLQISAVRLEEAPTGQGGES